MHLWFCGRVRRWSRAGSNRPVEDSHGSLSILIHIYSRHVLRGLFDAKCQGYIWTNTTVHGAKPIFDPVTSRTIEGVKIIDLKLRLGQPYVFLHSGTCEHLLIFHDLRLIERTDVQDLDRYPMVVYEKKGDVRCAACKRCYAAFVVEECERLPSPYMMFCDACFKEFFFLHGHKIGKFKAHPYMPINRFTIL